MSSYRSYHNLAQMAVNFVDYLYSQSESVVRTDDSEIPLDAYMRANPGDELIEITEVGSVKRVYIVTAKGPSGSEAK